MRLLIISAVVLTTTGCASTASFISIKPKVPRIERPSFAVDNLPIGSGIWAQMSALRAERLQRMAYEQELEAIIDSLR